MATTPIDGTGSTAGSTTPNAFSSLTSEQFVKIILTELTRQDPLNPNDTNALLEQMSSLRSIQSDIDLSKKLEAVVTQGQLTASAGMLGKKITGLTESFERVEGVVKSVSRTSDGPVLILQNGARVPFDNVDQLLDVEPAMTTNGNNLSDSAF